MTGPIEKRRQELEGLIAKSESDLAAAMAELKEASRGAIGIGPFISSDPWHWILFAAVAGAIVGLSVPIER